jgi:hypothetical protein
MNNLKIKRSNKNNPKIKKTNLIKMRHLKKSLLSSKRMLDKRTAI